MQFCVPGWNTLQKLKKSFHTHDIGSYTAKRHQLVCWQASVSWAVGGVCKVFACLLGSKLTSFGTEHCIAALNEGPNDENWCLLKTERLVLSQANHKVKLSM